LSRRRIRFVGGTWEGLQELELPDPLPERVRVLAGWPELRRRMFREPGFELPDTASEVEEYGLVVLTQARTGTREPQYHLLGGSR
jgi:hypothetical protein